MKTKITHLQKILKLTETGWMDPYTVSGLKNLQLSFGIYPSGVLDDSTITRIKNRLGIDMSKYPDNDNTSDNDNKPKDTHKMNEDIKIPNITTDLREVKNHKIIDYKLRAGEYIHQKTKKNMLFIHHTAGNSNPYACIDDWNRDSRGQIGTHFVIGGINGSNGNTQHDGVILRAIDDDYYAYHLGNDKGKYLPPVMTTSSISIELCNFGYLTERNGKFYTYVNSTIDSRYVVKLDKPFRGYTYWHDYSDKQLDALAYLIKYSRDKHGINIFKGIINDIKSGKNLHDTLNTIINISTVDGMWSHTNVRTEKTDIYPNPKLIKLFKNL